MAYNSKPTYFSDDTDFDRETSFDKEDSFYPKLSVSRYSQILIFKLAFISYTKKILKKFELIMNKKNLYASIIFNMGFDLK